MIQPEFSPQQEYDYELAVTLANKANEYFDARTLEARTLARFINGNVIMIGGSIDHLKVRLYQADKDFQTYERAATVLMPPRAAFDEVVKLTSV